MTPAEIRDLGTLGGRAFAGLVSRIEQVHHAIGGRVFASIGPASAPAQMIQDSVARGVYFAVRSAGAAAGAVGGETLSLLGGGGQPWGREPAASLALAALNAAAGDQLGPGLAPLAIQMAVRAGGHDVGLTPPELASAFPDAGRKIAIFIHGLAETEHSWHRNGGRHTPYGRRMQAEFGYTPVWIRYNTGRHVSENGRDLAGLLENLVAAWPEPVDEVLLAGHSMGGLIIRSACHYGRQASATWVDRVRHLFYLGSPHLGAPLARAAGYAGWAFSRVAETRPFASLAAGPSSVRDLRYGYLLDGDWASCEQDGCLRDHRGNVPLLAGANHYAISATVTADAGSPAGTLLGDLLIQPASAHWRRGSHQHIPFPIELGRGLGGMHHFDLLNHPDVWTAIRRLLAGPELAA